MTKTKTAIIIGAGPAGLTAAYELLNGSDIKPIIIEKDLEVGGLSKTINYKGNRLDIGGHRFFTNSQRILEWWLHIFPLKQNDKQIELHYHKSKVKFNNFQNVSPDTMKNNVFLLRKRVSRILFQGKFYDYPLVLNTNTFRNLGIKKSADILLSYFRSLVFPIMPQKTLGDLFINRFGRELYRLFFKTYSEKVWGVDCNEIPDSWGKQRIHKLSLRTILSNSFLRNWVNKHNLFTNQERSLIEKFLYPKLGPGQLWEEVSRIIQTKGGDVHLGYKVIQINTRDNKIIKVVAKNPQDQLLTLKPDYIISSMPLTHLLHILSSRNKPAPYIVNKTLKYRNIIVMGILIKDLHVLGYRKIEDNWIYIHDPQVKVARIQIYNNWSPSMVKNNRNLWIGMEYFCENGDQLWKESDERLINIAKKDLSKISFINNISRVIDSTVIRVPNAYPIYTDKTKQFRHIRNYLDRIENLYLVGRNGLHKYNNQDHSMLTAMAVVDNITNNIRDKSKIWNINTQY